MNINRLILTAPQQTLRCYPGDHLFMLAASTLIWILLSSVIIEAIDNLSVFRNVCLMLQNVSPVFFKEDYLELMSSNAS